MPEKHPRKALVNRTDEFEKDTWKQLKEKPGVKILSIARRNLRER